MQIRSAITNKMWKTLAITILCLINLILVCSQNLEDRGPLGYIKIKEIKPCSTDINNWEFKPQLNDDDSFSMTVNLPYDVDGDTTVDVIVDQYDEDSQSWNKNVYKFKDKSLLNMFSTTFEKGWNAIKEQTEPKIEESDLIKGQKYKLDHFKADPDSVNMPTVVYGTFDNTLTVKQDSEEALCFKVLMEIFPPEQS